MKNIAVIIPSKNARNLLQCVNAVSANQPKCDVLIVDDGIDWIISGSAWDFMDNGNLGYTNSVRGVSPFVFSRNINIGIRAAGPRDGYVLLNDDALLYSPDGFQLLAEACERDPTIGVIGAVTNLTGQPLQRPQNIGVRFVPHIAFVCVYIPQRTIDAVGYLDEDFVGYGCDDADYCEQVTRAGLRVAVHDECFVDHAKLHSSYRGEPQAAGDFSGNLKLLMDKWGTMVTQPNLRAK